jgi:Pentapeptide repeats (8 copies)
LKESNLREANLNGADLGEGRADMRGANLRKAKLRYARYLTHRQIKTACYWDEAEYAPGKLDEIRQDRASDPKEPIDCSRWKGWQ